MTGLTLALQSAGVGGLLFAAVSDLRTRIIPNGSVLWVLAAGLASRVLSNGLAIWQSAAVGFIIFVPLALLANRELIGGGDAKMIAAATFLVAPGDVLKLLLGVALAGGALSAIWLVGAWSRSRWSDRSLSAARSEVPYGVAILAGCAAVLIRVRAFP